MPKSSPLTSTTGNKLRLACEMTFHCTHFYIRANRCSSLYDDLFSLRAVSYTHLDVYKRQVLGAVIASITVAIVRIPKLGYQVQSLKPNFIQEMKEGMAVLRQNNA